MIQRRWHCLVRAHAGRVAIIAAVAALMLNTSCSKKQKALAAIKENFTNKNYEETMVLCEHALKRDIRDAEVYYYYGLSLLGVGRDYESQRRLEEAVYADSTLAGDIATHVFERATMSLKKGERKRAAERLKIATGFDMGIELGNLRYLVADAYFEENDFVSARQFYGAALEAFPDTSVAEQAYFNLARCYVSMADTIAAVATFEKQLDAFPRGELSGEAKWKLVNLLYDNAQTEFKRGNYEAVVDGITAMLERTTNASLIQRARFLLGETYERMEDYPNAYEQYRAIIREDRGASGRIVDRARDKINAFRDAGLL